MSLNSGVTPEGLEMGRAQILQAVAAKVVPDVRMNPVLLKPTSNEGSQVVLLGKVHGVVGGKNYISMKEELSIKVLQSYRELEKEHDTIVIEGAGSAAEINLRKNDFVNMGLARMVDAPVLLVADIDKGGAFASIYGTVMLMPEEERKHVKGIIINKFRGTKALLKPGIDEIEKLVGIPVLGVVPYLPLNLPEEDSLMEHPRVERKRKADISVGVINLPHISNYTDFQPLLNYQDIAVRFLSLEDSLEGVDVIILPGSKNTLKDLEALRIKKMSEKLLKAHKDGAFLLGICGGYQMLGESLEDPHHVESELSEAIGLGLIPMRTILKKDKKTELREGDCAFFGSQVKGYEIHMGRSIFQDHQDAPFLTFREKGEAVPEGYFHPDKRIMGTYLHGLFDNSMFTRKFMNSIRRDKGLKDIHDTPQDYWFQKEEALTCLADTMRKTVDMEAVYEILHEYPHL
jgi:adenosylcobyric acid synthase